MNPMFNMPNEMDILLKTANLPDFHPQQQQQPQSLHHFDPSKGLPSHDPNLSNHSDNNKNKRTRASPEQLAYLEASFKANPSPNCKVREIISQRINMPERSIQIWFQNRRAKVKLAQRKAHIALQEEALRQHYLAARNQFGAGNTGGLEKRAPFPAFPPTAVSPFLNANPHSSPVPGQFSPYPGSSPFFDMGSSVFSSPSINGGAWPPANTPTNGIFPCTILSVGTWQRMSIGSDDLVCGYSVDKGQMAWVVGDHQTKFRLSFPFSAIQALEIQFNDPVFAELGITINRAPDFAVFSSMEGQWTPCTDFTENQQASHIFQHQLKGEAQGLRVQLLSLLQSSPELSTLAKILPAGSPPSNHSESDAQSEAARRRQSDGTPNMAAINEDSSTFQQQHYLATMALDRGSKNRSLSLPTLPLSTSEEYMASAAAPPPAMLFQTPIVPEHSQFEQPAQPQFGYLPQQSYADSHMMMMSVPESHIPPPISSGSATFPPPFSG